MGLQLYTRWVSPLYILSIFGVQWQKGVCQVRVFPNDGKQHTKAKTV